MPKHWLLSVWHFSHCHVFKINPGSFTFVYSILCCCVKHNPYWLYYINRAWSWVQISFPPSCWYCIRITMSHPIQYVDRATHGVFSCQWKHLFISSLAPCCLVIFSICLIINKSHEKITTKHTMDIAVIYHDRCIVFFSCFLMGFVDGDKKYRESQALSLSLPSFAHMDCKIKTLGFYYRNPEMCLLHTCSTELKCVKTCLRQTLVDRKSKLIVCTSSR